MNQLVRLNLNSAAHSRFRSSLVAIGNGAWGIGGICIGVLTFYIHDAKSLETFLLIAFPLSTLGNLIIPKYSPKFLLKKGRVSDLVETLISLSIMNSSLRKKNMKDLSPLALIQSNLGLISYDFENYRYVIKETTSDGDKKTMKQKFFSQLKIFSQIFKKPHFLILLSFGIELSSQVLIYTGTTVAVGSLGLDTIQLNSILLGSTSALGSLIPIPFLPTLRRKRSSQILLSFMVGCGLILGYMSKFQREWEYSPLIQSILAAGFVNIAVWTLYCVAYTHIVESFPISIRGIVFGLVIFAAKIIGSLSAFITDLSQELGFNSLFLCSLIPLIALPFTLFLNETLDLEETKRKRYTGTDIMERAISSVYMDN